MKRPLLAIALAIVPSPVLAQTAAGVTIMNDPDVAAWQRSLLTQSMGHVHEDVADFTKQVVALEFSGKKP